MDSKTFSAWIALSGLDFTPERTEELFNYTRQLFASIKPGCGSVWEGNGETSERVGRIFGEARSIDELDLDQTAPALHFSPKPPLPPQNRD